MRVSCMPAIISYFSQDYVLYSSILTSESGPLSAPGQPNVTNSWHLLCTTKQQTGRKRIKLADIKTLESPGQPADWDFWSCFAILPYKSCKLNCKLVIHCHYMYLHSTSNYYFTAIVNRILYIVRAKDTQQKTTTFRHTLYMYFASTNLQANREYLAPKIHDLTSRVHSEAKLPLVIGQPFTQSHSIT